MTSFGNGLHYWGVHENVASQMSNLPSSVAGSADVATLAERFQALVSVAESINSCRDPEELFRRLAAELQRVVSFDRIGLLLYEAETNVIRLQVLETSAMVYGPRPDINYSDSPGRWVIETQQPLIIEDIATETRWPNVMAEMRREGRASICILPLTTARTRVGAIALGRHDRATYTKNDVEFMGEVAKLVALAVENATAFESIARLKDKLAGERLYLENEIKTEHPFEEIVGNSQALRRVLQQVEVVAATGSTVLLLGETGTGKELSHAQSTTAAAAGTAHL